jgi:hypothetical protein
MMYCLIQQFSTWGTRTPSGLQDVHRGYTGSSKNRKRKQKKTHLGSILDLGGTQRDTTMICGYAGEVNFD